MPPRIAGTRQAVFAEFVATAVRRATLAHGWTVPEIAERAGLGGSTLYRWLKGDWVRDPLAANVKAFCDTIGVRTSEAISILWPDGMSSRVEPAPVLPEDVELILQAMFDPNTSEQERFYLEENLRTLAARRRAGRPNNRRTG